MGTEVITTIDTEVTENLEETTTTTTTVTTFPYEKDMAYIRGDLDLIAGFLLFFVIVELCKWTYRFFNIFFPV